MANGSYTSISSQARLLILITTVVGIGFYLGISIYSLKSGNINIEYANISVKEFSPLLNKYSDKDLKIFIDQQSIIVKNNEIKKWFEPYLRNYSGKEDIRISITKLSKYLESLSPKINIDPVNARFSFKDDKAEIFVPSVPGKKINIYQSAGLITNTILDNRPTTSLAFDLIEPEVTLDKINSLGIKTLLGRGDSDYGKSSSARIHNIKIGLSKFNGIILKPGEEFSFNKILGEVDDTEGYQAELVIKDGKLVKEYGGGLCQVATTVFRGAILSGLDIKERKPHSFPVQYYNPQGFDATIYPGVVDLKFVNNTQGHILLQTKLTGSRLSAEIYGSNNGYRVVMDGPYQYDKQPSGAMKAYFIRKIYNGDQLVKDEKFSSVYKAPPPHPEERNPFE